MLCQRVSLRVFLPALALACLAGCGGGGDGSSQPSSQVSNSAPGSGSTVASLHGLSIKASDILGQASGEVPFAQQSGWSAQVLGQSPSAPQNPESGINGTLLANCQSLRFGKEADPTDSTKQAIA